MYFYFKNFSVLSENEQFDPANLVKGILYPLFSLDLLKNAEDESENYKGISAKIIFASQIIFVFGATLFGGALKLIGFFTFVPLISANKLFISANESNGLENQEIKFEKIHHVMGVIGCCIVIFMMFTVS